MYFITGNAGKFAEIQALIPDIKQLDIDVPEIQDIDPQKISEAKLTAARQQTSEAFIVDDVSLSLEALNGLPGPLIKWFLKTLGADGIYKLAASLNNFNATALATIGYCSASGEHHFFIGQIPGTIVAPRGDHGFGFDPIFQPHGSTQTYAEMTREEKNQHSHRSLAVTKLLKFLDASAAIA